jgi:predicted DNA binding CopG/RHH family protein
LTSTAKLSKKITIRLDEDSISFFKEISEQLGIPYQNIPINSGISASRKQGLA